MSSVHHLRPLRAVQDPIPWYVRVGYNDHRFLEDKLSSGDTRINRAVFDAAHLDRHRHLLRELQHKNAELVLDPRVAQLTMPAGQRNTLQALPWAKSAEQSDPGRYDRARKRAIANSIATTAIEQEFSAVLAPAHFLADVTDAWIDVDVSLTQALRRELDEVGGRQVKIYYPLIIPYNWLGSAKIMRALAGLLSSLPLDAVWMRVSNFKNDKSAAAVRNYIGGAQALLSADRPLIADHVGGLSALAILASGAAGGIAHGIAANEGFSVAHWLSQSSNSYGSGTRAYAADADLYLDVKSNRDALSQPIVRTRLGCKNKQCCPRGVDDMFDNAKRHIVNARFEQLSDLTQVTASQRAGAFIRQTLIPTGANLIKLDHALERYPELQRKVQKKRKFVDNLRLTLENLVAENRHDVPRSPVPRRAPFRPIPSVNHDPTRPNA